ncbi:MAG TPA: hypothetical protein VFB36_06905 [Nevskiaceae bacterium]|nr:hypothetical protein [Nevskiaceae bacterium]
MTRRPVALLSLSLMLATAPAHAKFQSALPQARCDLHVEDLAVDGVPLSYARALKLDHKATIAANGLVDLSPVQLPNGRDARVTIDANGCVRIASVLGIR